jgi:hypothetical protein
VSLHCQPEVGDDDPLAVTCAGFAPAMAATVDREPVPVVVVGGPDQPSGLAATAEAPQCLSTCVLAD